MQEIVSILCDYHCGVLALCDTADGGAWARRVLQGFRPREPRSGPAHVLQNLPRWLLFVTTVAALLLLGHAEPQLQLRSLSIFASGVLVALSPRLLRASYVVQSTVAERIECNPGPPPPPAGSDLLTDLHLDSALRLLRLRARFEFVPQTMLYPSVAVSLQDSADSQSKQEADDKDQAAASGAHSVQGPQKSPTGDAQVAQVRCLARVRATQRRPALAKTDPLAVTVGADRARGLEVGAN